MPSLSQIAHQRLYPSLTDPSYLVLRSRRLIFASWARQLSGDLCVLDIGGRYQPYRPLLDGRVGRYLAVDLLKTEWVSVLADGQALPFSPETFDLVIATQVFDYFSDPPAAAKQIHAVLRPGGILLASLPACAPRFAEGEQWRFTPSGIRSVLAPFAKIEIVPELSSIGSVVRNLNLALNAFLRYEGARLAYRVTVCPFLNVVGLALEKLKLTSNDQFTANYSVRAVKAE